MTLIDELVVLLRLDAKQFDKAAKEQVAAVQNVKKKINVSNEDQERIDNSRAQRTSEREKRQEKERKDRDRERGKSTQELGDKVKDVAFGIGGAVLGFETLKGAVNFLGNLSTATAKLGRDSQNLGMSAVGLQTWGNAVERAGGNADDAKASFAALSQQVSAFQLRGDASGPLMRIAQNVGVNPLDENRNARPFDQVLPEIVDAAIKRYGRVNAANILGGAGVAEGFFNLMADPNRAKYIADGQARAFATQTAVDRSQAAGAVRAGVGQTIKSGASGFLDNATLFIADSQEHSHDFTGGVFGEAAAYYGDLFKSLVGAGPGNHNPGNLMGKDGKTLRHFQTDAAGLAALNEDLHVKIAKDGLNTISKILDKYAPEFDANGKKINNTPEYKAFVAKKSGFSVNDALEDNFKTRDRIEQAMVAFENAEGRGAQVSRAMSTPGAGTVGGTTTNGGDTTLHVGTINVNAPNARDANGVAGGILSAMDNKLASQSNTGMTP